MESYDDGGMNGGAEQGAPSFSTGGAVPPEQAGEKSENGIREQLISKLTVNDTLLAALLMRTVNWTQNGSTISAEVDSTFLKSQLDAQAGKIASELSALTGQTVTFAIRVRVQQQQMTARDLPREVQLVCSMFKGTVVGSAPKEAGAKKQNEQKSYTQATDDDAPAQEEENDESL
jgi:DNA polymerase-3 subunit gamma/tau